MGALGTLLRTDNGGRTWQAVRGGKRRVELVVNGKAVAAQEVPADDRVHELTFTVPVERSSWLAFTDQEREALATHDHVKLFELGAHPFLTLTLFIALFERDYPEPLGYQLAFAARLAHWQLPYPDIAT